MALADYDASRRWFYNMSEEDRGLLQSHLLLLGRYNAIVDAEFGPATYRALTEFQAMRSEPQTGVLSSAALSDLGDRAAYLFFEMGMEIVEDGRGQFALLVPTAMLSETEATRRGTAFFDPDNAVRLETISKPYSEESYESLYASLTRESANRRVTYKTYNAQRFVVSGSRSGRLFYIFIHATPAASVGFSIEWDTEFEVLGGMLASFTASHSYPILGNSEATSAGLPTRPPATAVPRLGYGTGFFVAENGVLVTNHHVVDGCSSIDIPGFGEARLVTGDADLDLAVLRLVDSRPHGTASIRKSEVELGEDAVLVGYPLAPVLNSSLSVGIGIVSAEVGLAGEQRWFTTNVGIQPGNSGGPLLDDHGQVIGVAVAKVDEATLLSAVGTVAPNVGFAIKTGPLLDYLSIFRLPEPKPSKTALSVRETVDHARQFTVQVVCQIG